MKVQAICWERHPALPLRFSRTVECTLHRHAHSLSLSIKDLTKNTKILRETTGTAEEITNLIKSKTGKNSRKYKGTN